MARLRIQWRGVDRVAPRAAATGEASEKSEAAQVVADKPMWVFITNDDAENSDMRKLEDVVFANEQVALGSKFFDCIRMSETRAAEDRLLKEAGDGSPRLVFVTRDYEVKYVLTDSNLSAGSIKKAMSRIVRKEYKNSFSRMVSSYTKLLNELDRLDSVRARIADQRSRLDANPSPTKLRKLERDQKRYEKEMEKWQEKEKALLEFKPRGAKTSA